MREKDRVFQLCDLVRETGFSIHQYLGSGHLERIYEAALINRLRKHGLDVKDQFPIRVFDQDRTLLGEFFADLFIEGILLVELKACKSLVDEHTAQLLGYLRASHVEHGLLVNFGGARFEIKKYIMSKRDSESIQTDQIQRPQESQRTTTEN
jgi:GxxExxY protein